MNYTRLITFSGIACSFALAANGCTYSGGGPCAGDIERGLEIAVYDAQTHAPITAKASGTIQDGAYTETLAPFVFDSMGNTITLGGATERPGTYTVRIQEAGYAPYEMKDVRITKNACHVNRTELEVDLEPMK